MWIVFICVGLIFLNIALIPVYGTLIKRSREKDLRRDAM